MRYLNYTNFNVYVIVVAMASFVMRAIGRVAGARSFSVSTAKHAKVSVLGASGGIGQPLSLLLKQVRFNSSTHGYVCCH